MPRPFRCRRIEQLPVYRSFSPDDIAVKAMSAVIITEKASTAALRRATRAAAAITESKTAVRSVK